MAVLFMWAEAWFLWAKHLGYEWYSHLKWLVVQVLSIVALLIVLVWLSVFMYGSFYFTYMPAVTHTRDVHLSYRTDCEDVGQMCSFPSANFSLSRDGQSELLVRGQPYVIVLGLDMPESPVNLHLGMFMVKIQLYSRHGQVVHTSHRSALLQYKSQLYRTLETVCHLPMLLAGIKTEKQQVQVTLFDSFEEDPYKPAMGAHVEIQTKRIEVYTSSLKIHAKFSGLRYLLYHWPTVSALCGVGTNMFFLVVLTLMSWYRFGVVPDEQRAGVAVGQRLSLEERRSRIREILDRERRGHIRSGSTGSSASISAIPGSGIPHAYSQPNLSTHRRSSSMSYTGDTVVQPETITHSASTSNLQHMSAQQSQGDLAGVVGHYGGSRESLGTTDGDEGSYDSEKDFSTPSSGSSSKKETPELRRRQATDPQQS